MADALTETPRPAGLATRDEVESAARVCGPGPTRFVGWNMAEADLSGMDLRGCEFARCRGGHANFSSCKLTEARFLFRDPNNSKWRGTILSDVLFQDCKLTGAQMAIANALLPPASDRCLLINANFRGLSFRRTRLDGVDFQDADLREIDFREAVLTGCSPREANVTNARFETADLRGADLGNLQLADASRFREVIISKQQAGRRLGGLGLKVV